MLSVAYESERARPRRVVEDVNALDGRGGGVPRAQTGIGAACDLSSEREASGRAYPGLLPRLRAVEDAGTMDGRGGLGHGAAAAAERAEWPEEHGRNSRHRRRT